MKGSQINFVLFVTGALVVVLLYIALDPVMDSLIDTIIPASFTMTAVEEIILKITLPMIVAIFTVWIISRFTKGRDQGS